jgi:hypothetical protein
MDNESFTFTTDEVERIVLLWIRENYGVGHLQYNGNEINPETDAMTFTFGPPEDDDERSK